MNNQQRIDAAITSEHFQAVMDETGLDLRKTVRVLLAFFEVDPATRPVAPHADDDEQARGARILGRHTSEAVSALWKVR